MNACASFIRSQQADGATPELTTPTWRCMDLQYHCCSGARSSFVVVEGRRQEIIGGVSGNVIWPIDLCPLDRLLGRQLAMSAASYVMRFGFIGWQR